MPSIRLYVLITMLLTGGGIIWGLSALSSYYFISGMDISTRNSMLAFAYQQETDYEFSFVSPETASPEATSSIEPSSVEAPAHKQRKTITYGLVKNWEDLPVIFQKMYTPSELELNKFYKHLEKPSLLTPPKSGSFLIKVLKNNEVHYATLIISNSHSTISSLSDLNNLVIINLTALGVITLFTLILLFVMRQVTQPVKRLKNWAKNLNNHQLSQPVPDFYYSELNTLANIILNSLSSVQETLEREQKFLGYASHELRTPIAVAQSNSELLKKLIENSSPTEKQLQVLARILRANLTMTDLTETLLWLNRGEGKELVVRPFELGCLVEQLVNDLKYLTEGKLITLEVETDTVICDLPESVCRIIISNLIRNAFQHTVDGCVRIKQDQYQFSIINENTMNTDKNSILMNDHLGFGLGLSLTKKIIEQYQWQYNATDITGGRNVCVVFQSIETQ